MNNRLSPFTFFLLRRREVAPDLPHHPGRAPSGPAPRHPVW